MRVSCLYIFYSFFFSFSDAIVSQVLDELGLDLTDKLKELPSTGGTLSAGQSTDKQPLADVDADLQARLENLRRE